MRLLAWKGREGRGGEVGVGGGEEGEVGVGGGEGGE